MSTTSFSFIAETEEVKSYPQLSSRLESPSQFRNR